MKKQRNKMLIITLFSISILMILSSVPLSYFGLTNIFFHNHNLVNNEFSLLVFLMYASINLIALLFFRIGLEFLKKY